MLICDVIGRGNDEIDSYIDRDEVELDALFDVEGTQNTLPHADQQASEGEEVVHPPRLRLSPRPAHWGPKTAFKSVLCDDLQVERILLKRVLANSAEVKHLLVSN